MDEAEIQQSGTIQVQNTQAGAGQITIQRPAYTVEGAIDAFHVTSTPAPPIGVQIKTRCAKACCCSAERFKRVLFDFLPFIEMLRTYQWKKWIASDIVSGLSIGVIHIPQGMGFALLTSLPPVFGLYASFFTILLYFFFATSRHNSMGTMALISIMIGAVVDREAEAFIAQRAASDDTTKSPITQALNHSGLFNNDTDMATDLITFKVGIATSVTFMIGLVQLLMGLLKMGVVVTYMSMPFVVSFQVGAAVHIITSQVPSLLGISIKSHSGAFKVPLAYYEIFKTIHETNVASLVCGLICIAVLIILKEVINVRFKTKLPVPIPAELIIVILATLIAYFAKLNQHYDLAVVGDIPIGIPPPQVPSFHNAPDYIVDAVLIAIVSFVISITMAKLMAREHKYEICTNQELVAYGISHSVTSFFHGFAGAQGPPRTLIHSSIGGRTQLGSLVSCILVILTCYVLGPYLFHLPKCALAAIIIAALIPMFRQFKELKTLWRVHKYDFWVWVITFASICILDITMGLFIGIGISILLFTIQAQLTSGHLVKQLGHTDLYTASPKCKHGDLNEVTGIKIFSFGSALFFANVEQFRTQLTAKVGSPQTLKSARNTNVMPPKDEQNEMISDKTKTSGEQIVIVSYNSISLESAPSENTEVDKNNQHDSDTTQEITCVIIDCSCINYIDMMGLSCIKNVSADYGEVGITVALTGCTETVVNKVQAAGVLNAKHAPKLFPTIHDAVSSLGDSNVHVLY